MTWGRGHLWGLSLLCSGPVTPFPPLLEEHSPCMSTCLDLHTRCPGYPQQARHTVHLRAVPTCLAKMRACVWLLLLQLTLGLMPLQAYLNFGWGTRFMLWANMTEKGTTFSPSGHRLATVIWVHYISKVGAAVQLPHMAAARPVLLRHVTPTQLLLLESWSSGSCGSWLSSGCFSSVQRKPGMSHLPGRLWCAGIRVHGHAVDDPAPQRSADQLPARIPPRLHVLPILVGCSQLCSWRGRVLHMRPQLLRARLHVSPPSSC